MPTRFNHLFQLYALQGKPLPENILEIPHDESEKIKNDQETVEHVRMFDVLEQIDKLETDLARNMISERFLEDLASRKQSLRKQSYRQVMLQLANRKTQ